MPAHEKRNAFDRPEALRNALGPGSTDRFPFLTEGKPAQILTSIGCDRISVSFPVEGFNPDPTAWTTIGTVNPGTDHEAESRQGKVVLNSVDVMVGVRFISGSRQWWGKAEWNPSRVLDPEGWGVAPIDDAVGTVRDVVDALACELMAPAVRNADQCRVKRLDVARDFDVERPDFYLSGLGPIRRPWARRNLVHFDPSRNGAQTLMVGSGAGLVRLYDKHAETGGKAPEGSLRWEAECRSGWATNYGGIRTVGDLKDNTTVATLAGNRWEWSAMGVEVSARSRVLEKVKRSGLSPAKQMAFMGWLMYNAEGIDPKVSRNTAALYSQLARGLGVALGPEVVGDATGFVGRLDWASGREVLRAA